MDCNRHPQQALPSYSDAKPERGAIRRVFGRIWRCVVHNRVAIAIASLVWLIYRSGSQPRRLSYPCQQVAAVNVGAFAAGLIPFLWLWRKPACPVARRVAIRRQCVAAGILFVTALVGLESYQYAQSLIPPDMSSIPPREVAAGEADREFVGIYRQAPAGSTYTTAEIETMVRQAIALAGGLNSLMVDKNSDGVVRVVIKPNLVQTKWTFPTPTNKQGVVTDPRVCAAVVKVAREAGAEQVIIAEGTADNDPNRNSTWIAFTNAGFDTNSDKGFDYDTSVDLVDLNDSGGTDVKDPAKVTLVSVPNGVIRTQYYVPNVLLNCDALISVPTFKNHAQGTVTLSMKNHVGCAPNDIYHYPGSTIMKWSLLHSIVNGFPCTVPPCPSSSDENQIVQRTVVDLNLARPHDFAVVDALIGVTNGPNTDPPTYPSPKMQMIVAARGAGLAVDTVCTLCMKYNPDFITQLVRADSTGAMGPKDRRYITVLGNHVASVRSSSFPGGYAGSVLVETTSPTIPGDGINLIEGQEVWGTVPISVSGESDNVGVIKAELIVDGNYLATDTSAPYAFDWDTSTVSPGSHNVKVTVYDAALNEASIARNVMVVSPSPIITLQPTSLASSIIVGSNPANDSFTVDNTGAGILEYLIEVDQTWLSLSAYSGNLDAAVPPHTINVYYDCSALPVGQHAATITVRGQDAEITPRTIAVTVDVTPEPLEVDFSATPTTGTAPLAVQFTDLSTLAGASEWHWDFGDGQTSTQRHPLHSYTGQGHFNIRLTVVGSAKTQTAEKIEYIAVANPPKVAFIGGDLDSGEPWPPASDVQIMQYLQSKGLVVDSYKDVPAERPSAATIAASHDLVIASSSVTSGDVGGEFRYLSVPFIFWEPSLAINGREGLADGPSTITGQTQINVTDNTHPVMAGTSTGNVTVLNSSETLSYCEGSVASEVQVLATVAGNTNRKVVIAAEPGAQLLDGGTAAGRRAMLYLYDATWTQTNAAGKQIFDNAVTWALGPVDAGFTAAVTTGTAPLTVQFTDQSTGPITLWAWDFGDGGTGKVRQALHTYSKPGTYTVKLTVSGPVGEPDTMQRAAYIVVTPHPADLDADGDVDEDDMDIFQACSTGPGLAGTATEGCTAAHFASADIDDDNDVDQADLSRFQRCLSGPDVSPGADCAD
ncbi:MAG: DUF362 domain-containing protein [Phycisphaerae bacterium]|nr:DUF362 domain-containing protein [Phycisphaerae bacterium]